MGSFDEFSGLSSRLTEERLQSNSLDALSCFTLISLHIGPDPFELVMTFESPAPDDDSDVNAVRFSVVFEEVGDLFIHGLDGIGSVEVDLSVSDGYNVNFCAVDSKIPFRFGIVRISGVRRFKMAYSI